MLNPESTKAKSGFVIPRMLPMRAPSFESQFGDQSSPVLSGAANWMQEAVGQGSDAINHASDVNNLALANGKPVLEVANALGGKLFIVAVLAVLAFVVLKRKI
jgi:hypothetical protein